MAASPVEQHPSSVDDPLLLTYLEAAHLLGIGRTSTFELARTGQLRTVRFGSAVRIPRAEVERLIADRLAGSTNGSPTAAEAIGLPATSAEQGQDARPA